MKKIISIFLAMAVILSSLATVAFAIDESTLGTNIAIGKKVTAAKQFSAAFGVDKAVDGNLSTTFSMAGSEIIGEYIDGYNKLVVDLGALYELNCIIVRSRRDMHQGSGGWILEVAQQADYKDKVIVGEKPTAGEFKSDLIAEFTQPVIARYILFYGTKNVTEIAELEAYGTVYTGPSTPVYEDISDKNYNASKLIESLGIMQGISTTEFGVNKLTRRDEAAKLISIAAGLDVPETATSSFSDVLPDNEYIPYIEACLNAGIISKSDVYRPQDFVRGTEILKMLECAMGYDVVLPRLGEYPHNVLKLAKDLELTEGVEKVSTDEASREDILRLAYNALLTPVTVASEFTDGAIYYKNGESLLKRAFNVDLKLGVVTENDVTSLIEPIEAAKNVVKIDDVTHYDVNGALHELIGQSVYYLCTPENDVTYGWAEKKRQTVYTIFSKDIVFNQSSDTLIVVEDDEENEEDYTIAATPYVLKNGVAYDNYTIDKLNIDSGKVLLIDNNGDYIIDVIHIFEPTVIIANHAAAGLGGRVMVAGANGESVIASDYDYLSIKNGPKDVDTEAIAIGDLVYAYVSENKKSYIFDIIKNTVSGVLEEVVSDGLVIDGELYGYSSYYLNNQSSLPTLTLGATATFTADEHNDIVWVANVADASSAEVLAVTLVFEKPKSLTNAEIQLYTENAEFLTLPFADKVRIDGTVYTQADLEELMTFNPSYLKFKMTRYTTNGKGQINKMDTENYDAVKEPNSNLKGSVVPAVAGGTEGRRTSTGIFSGQNMILPILEDFPIFIVPCNTDYTQARVGEEYTKYYKISDSGKQYPKGSVSIKTNELKVYAKDEYGSPTIGLMFEPLADTSEHAPVTNYSGANGLIVDSITRARNANGVMVYNIKGYDIKSGAKMSVVLHEELARVINTDRLQANSTDFSKCKVSNTNLIVLSEFDKIIEDPAKEALYLSPVSSIVRGDVIRYQNADGMTTMLERVFTKADYLDGGVYKNIYTAGDNHPNFASTFRLSFAEMESFKNNILMVKVGSTSEIIPIKDVKGDAYILTGTRLTKCTIAELPMYIDAGTELLVYATAGNYNTILAFID